MSIITLGVWNTCLAFILWLWGLSKIPDVARGNYLFFLKPVIALELAFFILEDEITFNQLIAIFAITGFVILEIFYSPISNFFKLKLKSIFYSILGILEIFCSSILFYFQMFYIVFLNYLEYH